MFRLEALYRKLRDASLDIDVNEEGGASDNSTNAGGREGASDVAVDVDDPLTSTATPSTSPRRRLRSTGTAGGGEEVDEEKNAEDVV